MDVILIKEVDTLGNPGEILTVKDGYARNYLIPQKLAVRKSPTSLKILETQREEFSKTIAARKLEQSSLLEKLNEVASVLAIPVQASKEGKLYAAITIPVIQKYLNTLYNIDIDKKNIIVRHPIKTLGEHPVTILVSKSQKTTIKVVAEAIEE